ncbi:MAG: Fic family protein [Deltaproteobacteria bacterium]|nr:Fic family protein [Deltaproteobacteria bacterium]
MGRFHLSSNKNAITGGAALTAKRRIMILNPMSIMMESPCSGFLSSFHPTPFHGDERLIAMTASYHRLTWLHPFRDRNGRVVRLFSGLYLARTGVNKSNLWSLSRGLSRNKKQYMFELWATDSPDEQNGAHYFDTEPRSDIKSD